MGLSLTDCISMRAWLLAFFIICLNFTDSFAQSSPRYEFEPEELLAFSSYEALQVSEHMRAQDFASYPGTNFRKLGLPFDQIYHSTNLKQMVSLKFGLTPVGFKEGELIEVKSENLTVVHFRIHGVWALAVAQGMTSQELTHLLSPWINQRSSVKLWDVLFPKAYANDCHSIHQVAAPLVELSQSLSAREMTAQIANCLATGAQALTEGLKQSLDFYKRLATEPMAVWREFKQGMSAFGEIILNLKSEVTHMLARMSGFSPSLKAELICAMAGVTLGSAAQALILGPASFARAVPGLTLKFKSLVEKLSELTRMTRQLPPHQAEGLARELLQCSL